MTAARCIIGAGDAKDALYEENMLILDHLGTDDKALISFVERIHFGG